MRFRILGPLEVRSGQDWGGIGAAKQRALLAALLLNPGQAVSTERLIAEIWGTEPPAKATNLVSVYVLKLRRRIGDSDGKILVTRTPGYLLRLDAGDLDATRFAELAAQGRKVLADGAPERASALLAEALGLWRGQPLADVLPTALVDAEAHRLEESRIAAAGLRIQAELACGRAAEVVAGLHRLIADHPMHEELWALLMRALSAAGRQAEALEAYEQARRAIAAEFGVDPGAELQKLYKQILEADARPAAQVGPREHATSPVTAPHPAPAAPAPEPEPPVPQAPVVPTQLPADIPDFTGRSEHVRRLCELLSAGSQDDDLSGAVAISLVAGAGGLGKSTLAVHAAHRLRARFPDGQLYVSLQGASARPVAPADVLARFLRELGVNGPQIPVRKEERAALYRTKLNGRRMLIMLDDARDAAQVRPLLPGSASCGVLITSRNRLPDLAGSQLVDLDVLAAGEASSLLVRIVGAERLDAEPEATGQVLAACAGLPLALRIAGARLTVRAGWTIQTLAGRLANERRRIDEFSVGDLAVRACFQVSFASLPAAGPGRVDPARAFRLLGLWHGPSIGLPAAAALIGEPEEEVADALEVLVDAHLLQCPAADRYRFHDLLRVYAAERAAAEDAPKSRADAVRRVLEWYLHTTAAADTVIAPHRERVPLERPAEGCQPLKFSSVDDAFGWCETERANLVAATRQSAECGLHDIAWKLPVAAMAFFNRRGYQADWIRTHRVALDSARQLGDRQDEAWVLNNLGIVFSQQHMHDAVGYLEQALAIRKEIGDRRGEAQAANNLAFTYQLLGRHDDAIGPLLLAMDMQRQIGHRYGEASTLCNLGEAYLELGRIPEAIGRNNEALTIAREIGSQRVEAYALYNLGRAQLGLGHDGAAISLLREALAIHRADGDRYGEAHGLKQLGMAERHAGRAAEARESWARACAIFSELGDDLQVAEVRAQLDALGNH